MLTINNKNIDFIDFGASKGGCIEFAKRSLKGGNGLGIDINLSKVSQMKALGYDCIEGDITNLSNIPDKSVRFITISHVLEHLPNLTYIADTISEAIRISTDFIFIQGPYFDADEYLKTHGLKFYWSDWHGHTCHLTSNQLKEIIKKNSTISNFKIMARELVNNSNDACIHPIKSPIDQHGYSDEIHPIKESIEFTMPIYKELTCYLELKKLSYWDKLIISRKSCVDI